MTRKKKANILLIAVIVISILIPSAIMIFFHHADGKIISVNHHNKGNSIAKIEYEFDGHKNTISHQYNKMQNPQVNDTELLFINPLFPSIVHTIHDFLLFVIITVLAVITLFVNIKILKY